MRYELFPADELPPPGGMRTAQLGALQIVIVRTPAGEIHALRDVCSHKGAQLSAGGLLTPLVTSTGPNHYAIDPERQVIRCPYHGFEFDVEDGRCPADPKRTRVKSYAVRVEDGIVVVER